MKEENEFMKELFNLSVGKAQLTHLKEMIKRSKNGPNYFLRLLDHYSQYSPHQSNLSKELIECIYSCF